MTHEMLTPEERHEVALEDGSGVSSYVARERYEGSIPHKPIEEGVTPHQLNHTHARRKTIRTGRPRVEPGGQDISRDLANQEAIDNPDTRPIEERIQTNTRGAALARLGLLSPLDRIIRDYKEEVASADPDYRDRDVHAAELRMKARIRTYEDQQKSDSGL